MKQFYEIYKDNEFVYPMATQISWTNNVKILSMTKTIDEKYFLSDCAFKIIILKEN